MSMSLCAKLHLCAQSDSYITDCFERGVHSCWHSMNVGHLHSTNFLALCTHFNIFVVPGSIVWHHFQKEISLVSLSALNMLWLRIICAANVWFLVHQKVTEDQVRQVSMLDVWILVFWVGGWEGEGQNSLHQKCCTTWVGVLFGEMSTSLARH